MSGPDSHLIPSTLLLLRGVAILAAALGFAMFTLRLGWLGFLATIIMLLIPEVRDDLARAWAEGPLFLGLGLCALAYGSRWFGAACGLAVTFKLTALGMWPLLLVPGTNGRGKFPALTGLVSASAVFTLLTPAAWYFGGPQYLVQMLVYRVGWEKAWSVAENSLSNYTPPSTEVSSAFGMFLPTRYLLPIEWLVCLGLAWLIFQVVPRVLHPEFRKQTDSSATFDAT